MAEERKEKENREEAPRRSWGGRLLRGAAVLVLLAVVFGLVTAATMSGGRYKDRFRRWLLYGSSQAENLYSFSADSDHAFDQLGEYLAVASRNSLQLLRGDGTAQQEITIGMSQPALSTGGGLAVVWDAGGSALTVADGDGVLLYLVRVPAEAGNLDLAFDGENSGAVTFKLFLVEPDWAPEMENRAFRHGS